MDKLEPKSQSQDDVMKPQIPKYIPPNGREAESSSKDKEVMEPKSKKKKSKSKPATKSLTKPFSTFSL